MCFVTGKKKSKNKEEKKRTCIDRQGGIEAYSL
jgi:hypothetical protein